MGNKATQCERVLAYMQEFGGITQLDALKDLGVMRLASRISDLRKQGKVIKKSMRAVKNRYNESCTIAEYTLASGE